MNRPLCSVCNGNPAAINYRSGDKIRYRKVCASCARKGKRARGLPAWVKYGYKKKPACEKCGFKCKIPQQMFVYYLDGNLKNNDWANLKTICANCSIDINSNKTTWKQSPLTPDF